MSTLLYLVRHGETDWNKQRRIQGSTDIPLNAVGRDQALGAATLLGRRDFDGVVASPLCRALETGSIVAAHLRLPRPTVYEGLAERSYGEAEGLTGEEVAERYQDGIVPGREEQDHLLARVLDALGSVAEQFDGGRVVVATHGAVIRCVVNDAAPAAEEFSATPIRNGSVHSLRWNASELRAELVRFDDPIDELSEVRGRPPFAAQNSLDER